MNELATLLPIAPASVGAATVQTVDARKLYTFLEVGKDFSTWIKDRIESYDFVANVDFVTEGRSPESGTGNRGARIDYHLTLDTAKEIAMVERNDKGKQARRYFIECERRLHEVTVPKTLADALQFAADQARLIETQEEALMLAAPKVAGFDLIAGADGTITGSNAAKLLKMGPQALFAWLRENRWIFRRQGAKEYTAFQDKLNAGYLVHKTHVATKPDGGERICDHVRITAKGLAKLATEFSVTLDQEAA